MKSKTGLSLYLSLLAVIIAAGACFFMMRHERKIGFVLVSDVFDGFEMKKEMEKKYTTAKNARKRILDSLQVDLSVLSGRLRMQKPGAEDKVLFENKRMEYDRKQQLFEEDNAFMSKQLDEQIIKQLNQYMADFGKEKKYDIIYGNTTNGSIMYGTDELNITKEAITFINNSYLGLK
jgi:outer membrane protein